MKTALVIGAGPAGLMAAEELARASLKVIVAEAKPSVGRKFLMAGKSGLNLTKAEPFEALLPQYYEAASPLRPILEAFDSDAVQNWARALGQDTFTGSSGRVFPKAMKASPLLRAWLARLGEFEVELRTRWRWTGWDAGFQFDTPTGPQIETPDVTVLALGGASWARLGSDGAWSALFDRNGLPVAPFKPANMGLKVDWSPHMAKHFGAPLKGIALMAGDQRIKAEAVLSERGLEGGGIYAISRAVREGAALQIDLLPDLSADQVRARLAKPRGKTSLSNHLRKALRLDPAKQALLMEFGRPLPDDLAPLLKALPIKHEGPRPMDEAISTAGGVPFAALDAGLMLKAVPGVFCAGEMLDWEAPTGGYLITGCLATGRWAGQAAARFV
ncbi:MAG: TIGR03862 family flavoprotein [Pseudomonadota bacterium]